MNDTFRIIVNNFTPGSDEYGTEYLRNRIYVLLSSVPISNIMNKFQEFEAACTLKMRDTGNNDVLYNGLPSFFERIKEFNSDKAIKKDELCLKVYNYLLTMFQDEIIFEMLFEFYIKKYISLGTFIHLLNIHLENTNDDLEIFFDIVKYFYTSNITFYKKFLRKVNSIGSLKLREQVVENFIRINFSGDQLSFITKRNDIGFGDEDYDPKGIPQGFIHFHEKKNEKTFKILDFNHKEYFDYFYFKYMELESDKLPGNIKNRIIQHCKDQMDADFNAHIGGVMLFVHKIDIFSSTINVLNNIKFDSRQLDSLTQPIRFIYVLYLQFLDLCENDSVKSKTRDLCKSIKNKINING